MSNNNNSPSQQEWSQIVTFSHGLQSFDYFRILLKKTALYILSQPSKFPQIKNHQSDLLVLFLMQDNEPAEITSHMGKKQIIQQLRKIFQLALQAINDDKINNLINELR